MTATRQVAGRLGICAGQGRRMVSRQNALPPEWMEAVTCGPVSYLGMMWWGSPNKARQPRAQKAYAPWASALGWPDIPPSYVWPDWLSALMGILSRLTPLCYWMSSASWISRGQVDAHIYGRSRRGRTADSRCHQLSMRANLSTNPTECSAA
jgi:hypothetical protein